MHYQALHYASVDALRKLLEVMDSSNKAENISLFIPTSSTTSSLGDDFYRNNFKRVFDVFLVLLAVPLVLPILLFLIILIKIDSKGPSIYKSPRIGKNGEEFFIYKLRSMYIGADEMLSAILENNLELQKEWALDQKLKNDPRITRVGKVIRVLSLDELPQFINVLKGEMSFVGPRPIVHNEVSKFGENFEYYKRVSPGITGPWQISGRNDISYYTRVSMDTTYSKNLSFSKDLDILAKTIPAVLFRKGAY